MHGYTVHGEVHGNPVDPIGKSDRTSLITGTSDDVFDARRGCAPPGPLDRHPKGPKQINALSELTPNTKEEVS